MGIATDAWRCRIGLFCPRAQSGMDVQMSWDRYIYYKLLLSGNVETNPGPNDEESGRLLVGPSTEETHTSPVTGQASSHINTELNVNNRTIKGVNLVDDRFINQWQSYDPNRCILCQRSSTTKLTSTESGRQHIRDAARVRNDHIHHILNKLESNDNSFVYHSDNICYKTYTMKKTLVKLYTASSKDPSPCEPVESKKVLEKSSEANKKCSLPRTRASSRIPIRCRPTKSPCIICDKLQHKLDSTKYRLTEESSSNHFLAAAFHLQDGVYERIADIDSIAKVFSTDVYYHNSCMSSYLYKYKCSIQKEESQNSIHNRKFEIFQKANVNLRPLIKAGQGFTLTEIRDYLTEIDKSVMFCNKEIKAFLAKAYDDEIKFCASIRKNEPLFIFSSTIPSEILARKIREYDAIKDAAVLIRKAIKKTDFELEDKFCDADELEKSWTNTKVPDVVSKFLTTLCKTKKVSTMKTNIDDIVGPSGDHDDSDDTDVHDNDNDPDRKIDVQLYCIFQVMFFVVNRGRKRSPLHVLVGHSVYDKCKSKELITSLNRGAFSVSYRDVLRSRNLLSAYAIQASSDTVPFPSHFSSSDFTIAAFDNFDFADSSSLSGTNSTHHTAMVLFQDRVSASPGKPNVTQTGLSKRSAKLTTRLPCQNVKNISKPNEKPSLPNDFKTVEQYDDTYINNELDVCSRTEFLITLTRCGLENQVNITTPSWGAIHAIISLKSVPVKRVAFLPVIPSPVTEYSTVHKALENFQNVREQLRQPLLPVVCDEGVFHTVADMCMTNKEFCDLFPMLGMFHFCKVILRCAGRYLIGSGMDDALLETNIFGVKTLQSVLHGTHYDRALQGMLIIDEVIRNQQWTAFWSQCDKTKYAAILRKVNSLKSKLDVKHLEISKNKFHCIADENDFDMLREDFEQFLNACTNRSDMCSYWSVFLQLVQLVKCLITSDREGNWNLQVETIQALMKVLQSWDCTNYLRYGSWYIEKAKTLKFEHPELYDHFQSGRFVVKSREGKFNAVSADMKLEQTIQRSQKSAKGIIGKTRCTEYVAQWELVYHEVLVICNVYRETTISKLLDSSECVVSHELIGNKSANFNENVKHLLDMVSQHGNPFLVGSEPKLHNFITKEFVEDDISSQIVNALHEGKDKYDKFREERYVKKEKKISDKIPRVNIPSFKIKKQLSSTCASKKTSQSENLNQLTYAQKQFGIARERRETITDILSYDLLPNSSLFDNNLPTKAAKHTIMDHVEGGLTESDYNIDMLQQEHVTVHVDFMSQVRMVKLSEIQNFEHLINAVFKKAKSLGTVDQVHFVFDSYIDYSVKSCERIRRSQVKSIDLACITATTPIPVQPDKFWASNSNKVKLQEFAKRHLLSTTGCDVVISATIIDEQMTNSCMSASGIVTEVNDLSFHCEEADLRIIPHILWATKLGATHHIVMSNDTDVVILLLRFMGDLKLLGLIQLWIKYGTGATSRYIPIHKVFESLGLDLCRDLIKVHILTGSDYTSKIGTKHSAMKSYCCEKLRTFGENMGERNNSDIEEYLVKVWKPTTKEVTFDRLRVSEFKRTAKLNELPPTSCAIKGHIERSEYLIEECVNILNDGWVPRNPCSEGWIKEDGILVPNKFLRPLPSKLTVTCGCKSCNDRRCKCRSSNNICTSYCRCSDMCKNKG